MATRASIHGFGSNHISKINLVHSDSFMVKSNLQGHQGINLMFDLLTSVILNFNGRPHQFFNPESGSYPEVLYKDVMAKDEAVTAWLENIVSS